MIGAISSDSDIITSWVTPIWISEDKEALPYSRMPTNKQRTNDGITKSPTDNHHCNKSSK